MHHCKVGLIGHSHMVCLLDALGPWREQAGIHKLRLDPRYGEAFQGWFDSGLEHAFVLRPGDTVSAAPADIKTCLITGKIKSPLFPPATGAPNDTGERSLLARFIEQLSDREIVVSALFGNELADLQLINNLAPYDFAGRDGPSSWSWPDPQYQPIDRAYIERRIVSASFAVILSITTLHQQLPGARVIHVLPPPPLKHPELVARREALDELIARYGFVRPTLRLKWHYAYCEHVEKALVPLGIEVLWSPSRSRTREGFIREELSEGLTHGNSEYGSMLWEELNQVGS
jgi:hypothetical protein